MKQILVFILTGLGVVNSEISYVDVRTFYNYTVPSLESICLGYNVSDLVSEKCAEQLNIVCGNENLLLTMLDASSKFPYAGLGYATRTDYGNFDQCMTIDHKYEGGRILGEHCTIGLVIPDIFVGNDTELAISSLFSLSVCRPNGCTATDFNTILKNFTTPNMTSVFQDLLCQTIETNSEYTAADIVTIIIISVCVLIMILSSMYDFYLHKRNLKCPNQLYLAFSVITNGKKLLHISKQSREQIQSFQGLKVISMIWVIAGHGLTIWSSVSVVNAADVAEWQTKMSSVYIYAAPLSVDTFFFISGFLLAYQYLKQKPKPLMAHIKTVPSLYLHRYLRLTPALAMVFLVNLSLMRHFGSGPIWSEVIDFLVKPCKKYWWSFFLYIQNYNNYDDADLCFPVSWYLSADMQLFLLSPLVIIPVAVLIQKSQGFKLAMIQMYILNIFFIALPLTTKLVFRNYNNAYDTHSRLIDYYIGAMLGIFMRVKQDKPFLSMINSGRKSLINLVIWIVILGGMLATFLCYRVVQLYEGHVSQSIFDSLMRPAWCIGLSWIVYSCYHGYGGIVNWILTRPIYQVWGRLTYCMYLLHLFFIMQFLGTVRGRLHFSDYDAFYVFCGHLIATFILSVFWTLAFESPIITIEKVIFGRRNETQGSKTVKPPLDRS